MAIGLVAGLLIATVTWGRTDVPEVQGITFLEGSRVGLITSFFTWVGNDSGDPGVPDVPTLALVDGPADVAPPEFDAPSLMFAPDQELRLRLAVRALN